MVKGGPVYQFKISLLGISPAIWRRIQVPESYTFWDLHVAIQDSMGWLDYHLHAFRFAAVEGRRAIEIGIPGQGDSDDATIPGWSVGIADRFIRPGISVIYEYDFGDGWVHEVLLEGMLLREPKTRYPKCLAGARACPPEDCGGISGLRELLKVLRNPKHPEYAGMVGWLGGHARNYLPYEPDQFDPSKVRFMNPKQRLEKALSGKG
ncbi:MAG: hypothetical protein A3H91_01985 [Gammaproteobacteria bacterium RIFCSPLOWO2_02_FULL_61_13]|nr:MAG: hypothetical protein A3H91_01985 [Gammaproteobacteria bacterium RIFCSPLOWO2_02_FULL_61_13]